MLELSCISSVKLFGCPLHNRVLLRVILNILAWDFKNSRDDFIVIVNCLSDVLSDLK